MTSLRKRIYFVISILITLFLVYFTFFVCELNIQRFITAIVDFGISIAFYFCEFVAVLFNVDNPIVPSVIQLPSHDVKILFPETFEKFEQTLQVFGEKFISEENFAAWGEHLLDVLDDFSIFLMFLPMIVVVLVLLFKLAFAGKNNKFDVKTRPLIKWLSFEDNVLKPCKGFIQGYIYYFSSKIWRVVWTLLLLLALNIATIFVEVFAYLFYFAVTIDIVSLYTQLYKLVLDSFLMFSSLPTFIWCIIVFAILLRLRKNIALKRLNHMEMRNKGYVNALGVCTMFTGNMGVGKTKLMTDVSLSLSTVYKYNTLDILLRIERWFPEFSWATYQHNLRWYIWHHQIYSLTTCEDFVTKKRHRFEKQLSSDVLYGYDFERFGLYYNNGLQNIYLLDILEEYTKAFFVYYLAKSYILSNYSIREDGLLYDSGNLPVWDYNFFGRSPEMEDDQSYYANVLDFDILRKGKICKKGNPLADTFEFGIVVITELDKERGNTLDNQELKKITDETNRKNDLFNYSPKMGRHPATILYQPFIHYLFDQQRPTKTEADLREVCDKVVNIDNVDKERFSMPFFFIEEILYSIFSSIYNNVNRKYRIDRADNSLPIYFLRHTLGRYINWYEKMYNLYGYDRCLLVSDSGKLDGLKLKKDIYFLINKKALSNRYSTDCYKEFFRQLSRKKNIGLIDYAEFSTVKATTEELRSMNSYFIKDMDKVFSTTESDKK